MTGKRVPKKLDPLANQCLQLKIGGSDISGVTSQKRVWELLLTLI